MKPNTPQAWLEAVLGPDRDPHAAERAARVAAAKYDAERVRRPRPAPTPAEAAPSVVSARPRLRFCAACSTARHTDAPTCPCGGSWIT